jgi:hypothetical protein
MKTNEIELWHNDAPFLVRFDFFRGEKQWFDPSIGVGHPGADPEVTIYEVNFGGKWESPDNYPQLNLRECEAEILEKMLDQ